jgi:methylated-DNA-[protein]-cysteine S-methyltransferase
MTYAAVIDVPIPGIKLGIRRIDFLPPETSHLTARSPLAERAAAELLAYFDDPRHPFSVALEYAGSPFQRRVWHTLTLLPPGRRPTHGDKAVAAAT